MSLQNKGMKEMASRMSTGVPVSWLCYMHHWHRQRHRHRRSADEKVLNENEKDLNRSVFETF